SDASTLGATPHQTFAFLRDRASGSTTVASVSSSGALPDASAAGLGISSDGRYVLFRSAATNLGASGAGIHMFVRDRQSGVTSNVVFDVNGNPVSCGIAALSADGRVVAFESVAPNLVPNDTNGTYDVFVRDLVLSQTTRVSVASAG